MALILDTPIHLLVIEAIGVITSFAMYHLLALKKKEGWLLYIVGSLCIVYLMAVKDDWVTVINQSMMILLGAKNYVAFGRVPTINEKRLDWLSLPVYLASFFWMKDASIDAFTELLMWGVIIIKTLTLGRGNISGWKWQVLQQFLSTIFGWQREIYIYVFKSVFQLIQAIWGYWKWKKG